MVCVLRGFPECPEGLRLSCQPEWDAFPFLPQVSIPPSVFARITYHISEPRPSPGLRICLWGELNLRHLGIKRRRLRVGTKIHPTSTLHKTLNYLTSSPPPNDSVGEAHIITPILHMSGHTASKGYLSICYLNLKTYIFFFPHFVLLVQLYLAEQILRGWGW